MSPTCPPTPARRTTAPTWAALLLALAACAHGARPDGTSPDAPGDDARASEDRHAGEGTAAAGHDPERRRPSDETPGAPPPPAAPDPSTCSALSPDACLQAITCTLDHRPTEYLCRPAEGPCEEGLAQGDRAACESRAGCTWDPGRCYCPANVQCICGGGPPPRCVRDGEAATRA